MQLNHVNIAKVIDALRADDGRRFRMNYFLVAIDREADRAKPSVDRPKEVSCGTASCIAGWANVIRIQEEEEEEEEKPELNERRTLAKHLADQPAAAEWLGVEGIEDGDNSPRPQYGSSAGKLFWMHYSDHQDQFDEQPAAFRRVAGIAVLEILLATGKVDWDAAVSRAEQETGLTFSC